jgi:hypothetical protein
MPEHSPPSDLLLAAYASAAAVVAADAAASCSSILTAFTMSLLQHRALHRASNNKNAGTVILAVAVGTSQPA